MLLGSRLAGLAAHLLAYVTNAFPLIGLRRTDRPKLGRNLSHQLLVGPFDLDHGVVVYRDLNALGRLVFHRMRVPHDQIHSIGLCLRLVSDTLDLQALGEALGYALHHVLHQGAGQPVKRLVPLFLGGPGDGELIVAEGQLHLGMELAPQLASRSLHRYAVALQLEGDTLGHGDRLSTNTRHGSSYQTTASSSPPRLALRASRSVMSPRGVETMAMPSPFFTRGSSRHFTYRRRPGVETRRSSRMTGASL